MILRPSSASLPVSCHLMNISLNHLILFRIFTSKLIRMSVYHGAKTQAVVKRNNLDLLTKND